MGLIYATLGEHEAAVQRYIEATNHDQYLAVAYVVQFCVCGLRYLIFPLQTFSMWSLELFAHPL